MPVSFSENDWFTVCVRRELKVVLLLFRTCPYDYESSVYLDIFSMIDRWSVLLKSVRRQM